jgi:hypothetical protein
VAKSRTSLGTGSLSGRFIESLFRLKNPNPVITHGAATPAAWRCWRRCAGPPGGGSSLARRCLAPCGVWRARPFQDMLLVVIELARSEAPQPRHQVANVAKRSLAPASRSGLFSVGPVFFTGMPVRRRCVAGSLPRKGVGCCVPLLTHLCSHTSTASVFVLLKAAFLAPARLLPGLFLLVAKALAANRRRYAQKAFEQLCAFERALSALSSCWRSNSGSFAPLAASAGRRRR